MKISSFAFFLILFFSSVSHAYEISELKLKLVKDPAGAWSTFAVDTNYNIYQTELNLYEKQSDGSIISPVNAIDKYGKQLTKVGWVRFNCADENVVDLGAYVNGSFERNNLLPENHFARQIKYFYCPITSADGKRFLAYNGKFDSNKKTFGIWIWGVDDIQLKQDTESKIFNGISYTMIFKEKNGCSFIAVQV